MSSGESANAALDRMMRDIESGASGKSSNAGAGKTVLTRGCDPAMAQRASQMLCLMTCIIPH